MDDTGRRRATPPRGAPRPGPAPRRRPAASPGAGPGPGGDDQDRGAASLLAAAARRMAAENADAPVAGSSPASSWRPRATPPPPAAGPKAPPVARPGPELDRSRPPAATAAPAPEAAPGTGDVAAQWAGVAAAAHRQATERAAWPPPVASDRQGGPPPAGAYYPPPAAATGTTAYPPPPPPPTPSPAPSPTWSSVTYGPWWKRAVAALIDWAVLSVPSGILLTLAGGTATVDPVTDEIVVTNPGLLMAVWAVLIAGSFAYYIVMEGSRGATVGKMAMGLRLQDADTGAPIGYGLAFARRLVAGVLWAMLFLPGVLNLLSPLWDRRRQTWHDKSVNAVVVEVSAGSPSSGPAMAAGPATPMGARPAQW
ncbi:MAG: RDD family protein [Actinomycetota bacterium]